jgi:iron complex outermembrane receptor protein
MKAGFWLSVSAAALMSSIGVAHAQDAQATTPATTAPESQAATDQPSGDQEKGDIVITAERRSTSLQRTGVAATVLTGEDLIKKSVNTVDQLQFATPSLTVNNAGQGNQFNIRGIGKGELGSALGVGVITYRDGIATFPGYFQSEPYYDIASVEVLRGPQGTFAGGNATGGAVFITEKNPDLNSINGYVLGQYGNYNDVKLQGAINLPISDTLALRVATNDEWRDSFFKVSGPYSGNPGDLRSYSGRASLLWQPDSHLKVLIKGDYSNIETGGYPGSPASVVIGGVTQPNPSDPFSIKANSYLNGRDEFGRVVANISYTTEGGLVLRSITGFQKGTVQENVDYDGTYDPTNPLTLAATSQTFFDKITETIWSQELNIVSPDTGPLTWVLGGYYQHDLVDIPKGTGYDAFNGVYDTVIYGTNPKTALAAFGQVGYKLTDALQITLGARWSRTTSRNDAIAGIPLINLFLAQHDFTANKKLTGKVAINWTVDSNNFLYAFVATGSKAGGLNGVNTSGIPPKPFAPENVTDYELGWKGTWLNGHLRTQLGGYYNHYTGFQLTIVDPTTPLFSSIVNVKDPTEMYGAEFSAQGSFGGFGFDFSASLSHSEIGTFFAYDPRLPHAATPCNIATGPASTATGCQDLTGRPAVYAPQFTLSAGAQYAIQLGGDVALTPRVDYAHTAPVWATLFHNVAAGDSLKERNIVNAQLTLTKGPWSIAAYSTNLTDQHDIVAINSPRRLVALPRQFGARVSRTF